VIDGIVAGEQTHSLAAFRAVVDMCSCSIAAHAKVGFIGAKRWPAVA
jgi:hypothetical protein